MQNLGIETIKNNAENIADVGVFCRYYCSNIYPRTLYIQKKSSMCENKHNILKFLMLMQEKNCWQIEQKTQEKQY